MDTVHLGFSNQALGQKEKAGSSWVFALISACWSGLKSAYKHAVEHPLQSATEVGEAMAAAQMGKKIVIRFR